MTEELTFNKYQEESIKTAIYPDSHLIVYPALGLAGEAGEVANKVKKFVRDGYDVEDFELKKIELAYELGDVLWYCAALARDLDFSLEDIAKHNINKLQDRARRGTLQGDGDNR